MTITKERKKKIIMGIIIILVIAGLTAVAWIFIGDPLIKFVSEPEVFREWVDSYGIWSRLIFGLMVLFQVIIAVIPGEPFEIAAGYAFGAFWGSAICIIASGIGSIIVFLLVRKFGIKLVRLFFSQEQIDSIKFLKSSPKRNYLYLIIFIIPGTPKDLLSYFAGLTDIPLGAWALICTFGRIPSVVTSTVGGDALGTGKYLYAAIVFAITLAISGGGILLYNYIKKKHGNSNVSSGETQDVETKTDEDTKQ